MSEKIKVLHIVNGLGFGGAETWLLEMVKRNQGQLQFDFLLTGGVERELDSEFRELGCSLHYLTFSGNRMLAFTSAFNEIVRREKYQVVHDHEDFVAGWHWLFLFFRLPRIRICHAHNSMIYINNYRKSLGRKFFYKAGKFLNGLLATYITGTSEQLMEELNYNARLYRNKRIAPLYCGASPASFKYNEIIRKKVREKFQFKSTDKVVIFIGRIGLTRENEINHKNPEYAFSIAKELVMEDSSFKFLFVGEKGRLGLAMEAELAALDLQKNIMLTGKTKDVNELMMAADLMLFTSTIEPFGLVLIEAQFSSLPIVASDIITRETIVFAELLTLLDVRKCDTTEWKEAVRNSLHANFDRASFSRQHEKEIDDSIFSINASYERLLRVYQNKVFDDEGISFGI